MVRLAKHTVTGGGERSKPSGAPRPRGHVGHVEAQRTITRLSRQPCVCEPPTFLCSTVLGGESDENGQDENPGRCRSPAHHYRSAHSSLQSECILSLLDRRHRFDRDRRRERYSENGCPAGPGRVLACFPRAFLSFYSPVVRDRLTVEVTAPHTHTSRLRSHFLPELLLPIRIRDTRVLQVV